MISGSSGSGVLAADEIHLWLVDLDQPPKPLTELAATLATDELERAARFRFPDSRARFMAGRGLLRERLGGYLNRPPATLRFTQSSHGKPELAGEEAAAGLHFNLTHSGHQALYAVARGEVGVDLERLDRSVDHVAILERMGSPRERAAFQTLPEEQRQDAFFACWTRKEAMAKALGSGLVGGLKTLEVCFQDGELPQGRTRMRESSGREWSVVGLPLAPGLAGALAAVGADWHWCWV